MNALELLQSQHQEVDQLFQKLAQAADKAAATRRSIFNRLADALAVHGEIEEKIFYPAVKNKDTEGVLYHSVEAHLEVKKLISELLDLDPNDSEFESKCQKLQAGVQHHVREEQDDLFPKVAKLLDAQRLEELGDELDELASDLMVSAGPRSPRELPRTEAKKPAPL